MAEAAAPAPLLPGLPDDMVVCEILVRLPPKSLLRCRAVSPAWRSATSTRCFLLLHHARQPSLPVVIAYEKSVQRILALDHRSAADDQLQPVGWLELDGFFLDASCDGLLTLSTHSLNSPQFQFLVGNPATRQHASLQQLPGFSLLGMYLHRPSGEYRLLLYRRSTNDISHLLPEDNKIGCYVLLVGSDLPPRYIEGPEAMSTLRFDKPVLLRDSLHWSPVQQHQSQGRMVIVFDTASESFRQMRAPLLLTSKSSIFEMDGTLAIYSYNYAMQIVDIWVLPSYKAEDWECKYRVELPVAEIRSRLGRCEESWFVSVLSADGDVLLLVSTGGWLFYVDIAGKLVDSYHRDGQRLCVSRLRLKQTLVPQTFFTAL